ncbi:hypothetical protein HJG60_007994 [Phyllostomus discolor]|uniref:Uncharacterized protein n=1 Tax=Phyllostomus discolor TaxID=89673 RepID=A0A834BJX2_9CHIR|nr:hypothetical protein HJG60_007994 [Phyllostomus discolor]
MTTGSAERSLGLCSSAVAFSSCLSLSLLSLSTPSSSPLPCVGSSFPFFPKLKKKKRKKERKLTGALNLRVRGLLAERSGRGDSGRRGALPGEVRPPLRVDQGPRRHPRERRPRSQALPSSRSLCLACSPPAASLARPLGSSDSHYSLIPIWHPLCAHARHSFLRLLFCVCAANSFNDLFQRLQNVLNQLACGMLSTPSTAPKPEHTHTYWHISRSHGPSRAPSPSPFP